MTAAHEQQPDIKIGWLSQGMTADQVQDIIALLPHLTEREIAGRGVIARLAEIVSNRQQLLAVAAANGHLVGMATVTLKPLPSEFTAYIDDVVVHPDARGQGVASRLMDFLEGFAINRGATRAQLSSAGHREAAIQMYEERGYATRDTNFMTKDLTVADDLA